MSGPSTRSHRSSVRGMGATLAELSGVLKANKSVVIITGAGLSAASGIPTFRGGNDSIWCVTAAAQGRRSVFLRNPLRWYNEFWLRHFPLSFTRMTPNAGHEAIASLARAFSELRVITQNIDALQQVASNPWPDRTRLIEAHGRLGLFKCVTGDERDCPFSWEKSIEASAFPPAVREALEGDAHTAAAIGLACPLTEIPRCPHCGGPAPPMALLFDEDYGSHTFYDFDRVQDWLKTADAIAFVGTSFAVTLTSLAIQEAKRRRLPVYDFNLSVSLQASPALDVKTVIGPAENTLPELARVAGVSIAASTKPKTEDKCAAVPHPEDLTSNEHEDISPLGRRSREESPESNPEVDGEEDAIAAKVPRNTNGLKSAADDGVVIRAVAQATGGRTAATEAWGRGANFLLDPVLTTPLRKDQVRIDLSEEFSRKVHPDPEVEAAIEELWQEQLAKNPLIFNGTKFRLAGYSTESDRAATAAINSADDTASGKENGGTGSPPNTPKESTLPQTKQLRLRLGLTDYQSFRGTNWSPAAAKLAADSARDYPWLEAAYLSQKLGVGAIVETRDGFLLSLRRSKGVAEGQGMMGCPGGHPEPEKIGLTAEGLRNLASKLSGTKRRAGLQAAEELFDSAVQEVVDETNIPRSALGEALLSGIVRQGNSYGAPTAVFIIPCGLERVDVETLYAQGAKEAFESTELRPIPGSEIVAEGGPGWFTARNLEATPSFQGSLELWRAHRLRGVA